MSQFKCVNNALQRNSADYFFFQTFKDDVIILEKCFEFLKEEINTFFGTSIVDLEYKLKRTEMKINNVNRELVVGSGELGLNQAKNLAGRIKNISEKINQMRQKMRDGNLVFELTKKKKYIIIIVLKNYHAYQEAIVK